MGIDTYKKSNKAIDVSYDSQSTQIDKKDLWRTEDERLRVKSYESLWKLFLGRHYIEPPDYGIWPHPYGPKGVREKIPYEQINLLGKSSRCFADLIVGEGMTVVSEDEATRKIIDDIVFRGIWESLILSSVFGFVGIQPQELEDKTIGWINVRPQYLYPKFHPARPGEVIQIKKMIPFLETPIPHTNGKTIDILYEETHTKGQVITRLYEIQGEYIKRELDLVTYTELIDPDTILDATRNTEIDDFLISLLYNEKIEDEIFSDYTITAQKTQQNLNSRLTQIDRILKFHADPKLIAPECAFTQDPESKRWIWTGESSEVLIQKDNSPPYSYLTWDGELSAAVDRGDKLILSLHTELDMSPQLTAFTHLIGGTTAETAAKLKLMLQSTIKRAGKKQEWALVAIDSLINNILVLSKIKDPKFTILFPEFIPQTSMDILGEVLIKKQGGLITTVDAIMEVDKVDEEVAKKKAVKIFEESANEIQGGFGDSKLTRDLFPPLSAEVVDNG